MRYKKLILYEGLESANVLGQAWSIPGFGQQYYTQYYTGQTYANLYNSLYQYNTKSNNKFPEIKKHQTVIFKSNVITN